MGIFDRAKEAVSEHTDAVAERTGPGYIEQVGSGSVEGTDQIGDSLARGESDAASPPPGPVTDHEL